MITSKWFIIMVVALSFLLPREVFASGACTAARLHDWNDMGCNQNCASAGTPAKSGCPGCHGMPRWWVSEPYINLCTVDTPLSYTTSSGQEMAFKFYYHQRSKLPDSDEVAALPTANAFDDYPAQVNCGTNASWGNNWNLSITIWDPAWETNWFNTGTTLLPPSYAPYSRGYQVFVWRPEGGINYFNVQNGQQNIFDPQSLMRLASMTNGQNYPVVPIRVSSGVNNPQAPDASGIYWAQAGIGVELIYPDGSQDIFGLAGYPISDYSIPYFYNPAGYSDQRLLLTQRIDPQGRVTQLGYEQETNIVPYAFRLRYVVDPDGRTNTFLYSSGFQLAEIDDPFGRKTDSGYDSFGELTNLVDAAGLTNSFQYMPGPVVTNWNYYTVGGVRMQYGPPYPAVPPYATTNEETGNGWITALNTPYGSTLFNYYAVPDATVTDGYQKRAIYVAEPEGAQQLYLYQHQNPGFVPASETAPSVPGQTNFDNGTNSGLSGHGALTYRNTFRWGRLQYAALSGNSNFNADMSQSLLTQISNPLSSSNYFASGLAALGASDYNKAWEKHWLMQSSDDVSITEGLSSERDPSPDPGGSTPGLRTWYNYPGKPSPELMGSSQQVTCVARILPDGSTQYTTYNYYSNIPVYGFPAGAGFVSDNEASYSKTGATIGVLTNWFTYAANSVDLIGVSNSAGQYVNYGYNGSHQITTATNSLNQVTTLSWAPSTFNLTGVQMPAGKNITLSYNSPAIPPTATSAMLQQISILPEGRTFTINNYSAGQPSSVTDDRGLSITNTWDGLNRLTGTSFPDNTTISNIYNRLDLVATKDRLNNWTHYAFDGLQHLTATTNANNAVTLYSWCGCGSLTAILDALTNLTTLNYDNQGNLTNVVFPDTSSITWQFDLAGRVTNVFDGIGRNLQFTYNNQGLPTSIASANGTLRQTIYDALNRPISITDANGGTVTNQFDAINELLTRTWPDTISEGYGYNAAGLIAYTNRDQNVTRYGRDGAGRLTSVTNANTEVTQFAYDSLNNITSLVDGLHHQTAWQYNEYGWLTNKQDGLTRNAFRFGYNANGWVTNRWTPEKGNTGYAYDNLGDLTNITYGPQSINYAYDALNRLTNMVDAIGTNAFSYTPSGQLQSESGPWTNDTLTSTYAQGLRTALTLSQTTSTWSQSYGYDSGWRLQTLTSPAGSFNYAYNFEPASSLVTGITLPNGASIVNSYDGLARLTGTALDNHWTHTLDGYAYTPDALGLRTNILRNLGLTSSTVKAGFDNIGQLTSWNATEAGGTPRQNEQLGFGFDAAHNLHTRGNGSLAQTFTVDAANQLNSVTRTGTFTLSGAMAAPATNITVNGQSAQIYGDFTFAATNNVLANGNNPYVIIAQNLYGATTTNSLTNNFPASVSLSSDNNGNLTNDGTLTFGYDSENQLTNVSVAGQWKLDFIYDGLNRRRVSRNYYWNSGSWFKINEVRYIYDGFLLIQDRDTNNNPLATYTRGSDLSGSFQAGGIGGLLARTDTNGTTFYHADGNGNITALMDGSENIVARYLYGPFGKLVGEWGPMASVNEMQFSSIPYHNLSGLLLYPFRAYDPNLQRWLNQDPIGEAGGLNLYRFVGNDPINRVDPLGLSPDSWAFIGPFISNMELNAFAQRFSDKSGDPFQDYNDAMRYFHPRNADNWTVDDPSAVQAGAEFAKAAANGYLAAATSVTPTAIGGRAACNLTQQGLEHIAERHLFTSGAQNAGKFAQGMGARTIRNLINEAVAKGVATPNTFGRPGQIFNYDFGRTIGTDIAGNPATNLRVVVNPAGNVVTAFPY
jgi:RHS repeat-associated protein